MQTSFKVSDDGLIPVLSLPENRRGTLSPPFLFQSKIGFSVEEDRFTGIFNDIRNNGLPTYRCPPRGVILDPRKRGCVRPTRQCEETQELVTDVIEKIIF